MVAPLLALVFGIYLRWLPVAGWEHGRPADLVLPVIALALPTLAYLVRLTRASVLEVLSQPHVRTADAKGLAPAVVLLRHVLPPALSPVLGYLGPAAAGVLTGSLVVETVFGLPGMGRFLVQGALNRDYTLVMGKVIVYAMLDHRPQPRGRPRAGAARSARAPREAAVTLARPPRAGRRSSCSRWCCCWRSSGRSSSPWHAGELDWQRMAVAPGARRRPLARHRPARPRPASCARSRACACRSRSRRSATLVSLVVGVGYGAIAGYAGGRVDALMMRAVDVLYSLPYVFFVILLTVVLRRGPTTAVPRDRRGRLADDGARGARRDAAAAGSASSSRPRSPPACRRRAILLAPRRAEPRRPRARLRDARRCPG